MAGSIDRALVALLAGDGPLMTLTPDGVFWDEGPPHATRLVIVSLLHAADTMEQRGRGSEDLVYQVTARILKSAGGSVALIEDAAARIDQLLEGALLIVDGYTPMVTHREERIRHTEVDDLDDTIRWFHGGGQYRIAMSLDD